MNLRHSARDGESTDHCPCNDDAHKHHVSHDDANEPHEQEGDKPAYVTAGGLERWLSKGNGGAVGNARLVERKLGENSEHDEHKASGNATGDGSVLVHEEGARKDEERYGHQDRTGTKSQGERMANHARHDSRRRSNQRDEHGNGHDGKDNADDVILGGREALLRRLTRGALPARCLARTAIPRAGPPLSCLTCYV